MRLRIMALAVALGLGIVGIVSADDSGSWLPRWLSPWSGKTDKSEKIDPGKTAADKEDALKKPPVSDAARRKQAKADLLRRQEVCLKLREIADAANDEDTLKRIDQLESRAWALYAAATNLRAEPPRATAEATGKKEGR